jgi:hypothetical protein
MKRRQTRLTSKNKKKTGEMRRTRENEKYIKYFVGLPAHLHCPSRNVSFLGLNGY